MIALPSQGRSAATQFLPLCHQGSPLFDLTPFRPYRGLSRKLQFSLISETRSSLLRNTLKTLHTKEQRAFRINLCCAIEKINSKSAKKFEDISNFPIYYFPKVINRIDRNITLIRHPLKITQKKVSALVTSNDDEKIYQTIYQINIDTLIIHDTYKYIEGIRT